MKEDGFDLYYHNHHIEFLKVNGQYLLDILRENAPHLGFELDTHWIQRGGENPVEFIKKYAGSVRLLHLKDYRIANVQMPMDGATINQFFRQQTQDTGQEPDRTSLGKTVGELFVMTGPGILMTHSRSGQYGWATALAKPNLVKAIVAYEPAHFVFPEGEVPPDIPRGKLHVSAQNTPTIPLDEFKKLTRMPILIVFGDNIAQKVTDNYNSEVWRSARLRARQFVEAINRHGGDATLVSLPEIGLFGNTHIPFADRNNLQVADQLVAWLHEKGLDRRDHPHMGPQRSAMELTIPLDGRR